MRSFHVFGQAVTSAVVRSTTDCRTGGAEITAEGAGGPTEPEQVANAMASAWGKIDFEPLEEVVER